jgi:two-component system, NtrC family, response regulator AtoC
LSNGQPGGYPKMLVNGAGMTGTPFNAGETGGLPAPPAVRTEILGDDCVFLAASPSMQDVHKQVIQISNTDVPVLLLGESGTGKEVVARLIHKFSTRNNRTFMKVNCAALPAELLESELFGHEAGAFTGATRSKPGKFEVCHRGTLLLDEIAEMPIVPQAKLLHVLQDGEFARLGSPSPIKVDVRIIAATNVNITRAIASQRFREDLYYRLNAFVIQLPPLRERKEDIPILLNHAAREWGRRYGRPAPEMSQELLDACLHYHWPGNVRELENFVRRYLIVGSEEQMLGQLRSPGSSSNGNGHARHRLPSSDVGDLKSMMRSMKQEAEKEVILRALEMTGGNRKEAAAILNISLRAVFYKIRQYGIEHAAHPAGNGPTDFRPQ